jgi:hypothetical protein
MRYIPLPTHPPSQSKDWQALNNDIIEALLVEVGKVQNHAKKAKVSSHDSIYTGISGEFRDNACAGVL